MTRNSSLGGTGDINDHYAVPQAHIHHHVIAPAKSTSSLMRCGSCPGSTGVSRRGSSSQDSSPIGTIMGGGSDGASRLGSGYYTDRSAGHYDRMPIPIPVPFAPVPRHISNVSEDEVEPAYATVFPNTPANVPQQILQSNPYQVEDRNIHRRGARRWRKLYRINGHIFQAKRFNRVSLNFLSIDRNF